ncbi:cation/H(+) antiporter 15 [Rosa sericea]
MANASNTTQSINPGISGPPEFCISSPLASGFRSIWYDRYHLDHPLTLTMAKIMLFVVTSQVLHCFLKPLGQTKFVCNLLAGIILGPSVIGNNKHFRDTLFGEKLQFPVFDVIAQMGVVYSLFLTAVKLDLGMLKRTAKTSWKIFLASLLCPTVVFFSFVYPLAGAVPGFSGGKVLLFWTTSSLSFTYFPVIAQALDELNLLTSELGQLALSASMLNDALQWFLTALNVVVMQEKVIYSIGIIFSLFALVIFTFYVARPLMLFTVKNTPEGYQPKEIYVVAIQLGVLVMAFMSDAIGMSHMAGPIILGLAVPDGQLGATLIAKTEYLVSEVFLPLFFFRIGTSIDMYKISRWVSFTKLQAIIIAFYASKTMGITMAGLFSKISLKNSLVLSMMMNIKGILELILYNGWLSMKLIDEQFFAQMVFSLLAMTMLVTPMIRFSYIPPIWAGSKTNGPQVKHIQSMASKSETFRILCCVHNEESVHSIITLLEASNPTEASPITVYVVHALHYIGRAAPVLVPCKKHKKKFKRSDTASDQIVQAFENYSKNSGGPVAVQAYTMVNPYKYMHQTIFRLAQDQLVPLIIIPFHENHQSLVDSNMTGPIRQFNLNVQAYSPCTVGILVDRGSHSRMRFSSFFYNIAVFFIGGPDDREALAYTSRMCDNPEVELTVFRIIVRINKSKGIEEETEFKLDESLVQEFKLRNLGNDRLNWHDIEVDDCVQVMTAISSSQGHYDLVMVGKRHSDISLRDEEMVEFVQNSELGVIGDMLASSDFCGGTVNVLVMQESRDLGIGAFRCDSLKS